VGKKSRSNRPEGFPSSAHSCRNDNRDRCMGGRSRSRNARSGTHRARSREQGRDLGRESTDRTRRNDKSWSRQVTGGSGFLVVHCQRAS
jgi:hypothetical protein